jgi:hypothetical protein
LPRICSTAVLEGGASDAAVSITTETHTTQQQFI